MMTEDDDDFLAPEPSNIIPFPRLRGNQALSDTWNAARSKTRYALPSPLEVVDSFVEQRKLPPLPWPAAWPELGRRCRTYPGDCIGVTGAIGGGKTSFAIQMAIAAIAEGIPVLWVPLELGREEVMTRIVANMYGVHVSTVRDHWDRSRIEHALATVTDLWHFVDRFIDVQQQLDAIERAIEICVAVYRVRPLTVIDHMGEFTIGRDERHDLLVRSQALRDMALRTKSYFALLNQVSVSNQAALTGRVEVEQATDAMGLEAGGKAIAGSCANSVLLAVFKAEDSMTLDAHALLPKARHTGLEGRVGMRFSKPGGQWMELDYLPATPGQVKEEVERAKKDKHRATPPPAPSQARADINAAKAGDAAAQRRVIIREAIARHGALGMELLAIRRLPGAGRGPALMQALQELERSGDIERTNNRYRIITR